MLYVIAISALHAMAVLGQVSCQKFTCTANQSSPPARLVTATDDSSRRCGFWGTAAVLASSESRLLLPLLKKLAATVSTAEAIAMPLIARMTEYFCNFDDGPSSGPRFILIAFRRVTMDAVQRPGRSILEQQHQLVAAAEQRSSGVARNVFEGCANARESLHAPVSATGLAFDIDGSQIEYLRNARFFLDYVIAGQCSSLSLSHHGLASQQPSYTP